MLYSGADPESYITKYTLVYKDYTAPPYQTKCRHGHLKHSSVAFGVLGLGFGDKKTFCFFPCLRTTTSNSSSSKRPREEESRVGLDRFQVGQPQV